MRNLFLTLAGAALVVIPAQQAQAQFTLGPAVAWHDDFDLGVGGYFVTPLTSLHENVALEADFLYFFPDEGHFGSDFSYFEVNADLVYTFVTESGISPFALGGLNIARFSVDSGIDIPGFSFDASATEVGLNLGGGVVFGSEGGSFRPVVGAKVELSGGEGFVVFGGLGFPIG